MDATPSGMASVIGLSADKAEELAARAAAESGAPVSVANYLCNGNYAVSGAIPAIDKVEEIAKPEFKARMVVRLAVAGAFHTDFMAPAADKLKAALDATPIKRPESVRVQRRRQAALWRWCDSIPSSRRWPSSSPTRFNGKRR